MLPSSPLRRNRRLVTAALAGAEGHSPGLGYIPALDGLRGLAIALVIADHYFGYPPGGLVGVDLFFVLSGFLITSLLLEERLMHGVVSIRGFYERRARRLLPALFVMLASYLLGCAVVGHNALRTVALGGLYIGNVVQAWNLAPVRHSALVHLWSLAEEEQFYLLWPLLLLVIVRRRNPILLTSVLLAGLLVYKIGLTELTHPPWWRLDSGPDTHADGLLFGSLLALVRLRRRTNVPEWFGKIGISALAAGAVLGRLSVGWFAFGLPIFEAGLVFLLAAAVSETELAKALRQRHLVGLGKISYSLYLWHGPVWFAIAALPLSRYPVGAIALPTSLGVAVLSHRYVEKPFRRHRAAGFAVPERASAAAEAA
jgi:peptidoglycan/LPS O-acetylase OafA/YrhL